MLDLDKIGPDWKLAEQHGLASTPGRALLSTTVQNAQLEQANSMGHKLCQCCLNLIHKEPIPFCENSKQLQFLGFGFPLYFIFTKYLIILLLIQVTAYSIISIKWAFEQNEDICVKGTIRNLPDGSEGACTTWLIRFARTQSQVSTDEILLRLTSFFIHLLSLLYIRDTLKKTQKYYEERTTSLSHYSLMITNMPNCTKGKAKIKDFLQKQFNYGPQMVEDVIILSNLQDYYLIQQEKQAIIRQKQAWLRKHGGEQCHKLSKIDGLLNDIDSRLEIERNRQIQLINLDEALCENAIIIMESERAKNDLRQKWKKFEKQRLVQYFGEGANKIQINKAPQPKEIIWENMNYPTQKRTGRLILGWVLTVLLVSLATGVFYAILIKKGHIIQESLSDAKSNPENPQITILRDRATAITILTMLLVIFFNNFLFSYLLHIFTDLQKHRTGSQHEFSFCIKYILCIFFNSSIMTILVEDISFHNIYREEYGVIEEESIMFFFSAFLDPLIWLVNPWHLFRLLKRWWFRGRTDLTQREANFLMEAPAYSMGKKYAQIIESVWMAFLYHSIIPGGCLLMLFGIICFYWVDKITLLRRSSVTQNVNAELNMRAMKLLDVTLLFRAIGQMIFDSQIRNGIKWYSIVCVIIGGIYLLLPIGSILIFFHEEKFREERRPYKEVSVSFVENYHTMQPLFTNERHSLVDGFIGRTYFVKQENKQNNVSGRLIVSTMNNIYEAGEEAIQNLNKRQTIIKC